MIITDIVPVTKQKYRITTDEQLTFMLYKGELSCYQLEKDIEISEEVWEEIKQVLIKRAKLRAMHLLTRMDYTETELYRKLMQGEYTKQAVECAIEYVKSFHYLDDKRYVVNYMAQKYANKSRCQKEFELERKGISKDCIREWVQDAKDEIDESEINSIKILLQKRCKNPEEADQKEKMKHYGYLARKGFNSRDIMQVFESYFQN